MEREVALDDPGEGCAAEGSGCSADADYGGDGGGGEHICGSGEEIGAPALMGGGGEGDEERRGPGVGWEELAHVGDEDYRQDAESGDEHGDLAAVVGGEAAVHEGAGEGAAG